MLPRYSQGSRATRGGDNVGRCAPLAMSGDHSGRPGRVLRLRHRDLIARFASGLRRSTSALLQVLVVAVSMLWAASAEAQYVSFSFNPSGGTYEAGQQLSVTVEFCGQDEASFAGPGSVFFNDQWVNFSVTPGSNPGCSAYQVGSGTITLVAGTNTLRAEVSGNGTWDATEYYQATDPPPPPPPPPGVIVSPSAGTASPAQWSAVVQNFTVENTGGTAATFLLTVVCGPPAATGCVVPASVTVGGQQATTVNVAYQTGEAGLTGTLRLRAALSNAPGVYGDGAVDVTVAAGGPASTVVSLADASPATSAERDLSLTVAVRLGAGVGCRALRLAYRLAT